MVSYVADRYMDAVEILSAICYKDVFPRVYMSLRIGNGQYLLESSLVAMILDRVSRLGMLPVRLMS